MGLHGDQSHQPAASGPDRSEHGPPERLAAVGQSVRTGGKTRFGFNVSVCSVYTGDSPQGDLLDRNADFFNCRVLVLDRACVKDLGHYLSGDVMVSRCGVDVQELEARSSA